MQNALEKVSHYLRVIFKSVVIDQFADEEEYARFFCVAEYVVFGREASLMKRGVSHAEANALQNDDRLYLMIEFLKCRSTVREAEEVRYADQPFAEILRFFKQKLGVDESVVLSELVSRLERETRDSDILKDREGTGEVIESAVRLDLGKSRRS